MSVHDDLPWLADERALLAPRSRPAPRPRRLPRGPAAGRRPRRRVTPGPAPECGVGEVHLTGRRPSSDPVFGPAPPAPVRALARRHLLAAPRVRCGWPATTPTRTRPSGSAPGPTGCSSTWRSRRSLVAHWGPHLPPGVFVRTSDVAHVARAGEGIVRRFVALAETALTGRRPGRLSSPSGAARNGGSRRGGSTRPPWACRCEPSPGTRSPSRPPPWRPP